MQGSAWCLRAESCYLKETKRNTVCNIKELQRWNQDTYATMTRADAACVEKELKD